MGLPILADDGLADTAYETHGAGAQKNRQQSHQMPGAAPHDEEKKQVQHNLAGVGRVIGVHSGKGGVGKTFVAVNIAFALAKMGKKVGLLDADIDCPNVVRFLNLRDMQLSGTKEGRISPIEYKQVKIISSHFLSDAPNEPMIIRGPIKHKVLAELLANVEWGDLDVLVYDLPPGTSDVPLSSFLIGNLTGLVVVTTPQKEAIMDAKKSVLMAKEMQVPVLGIIENMSGDVFGEGAGRRLAEELNTPYLGSIPLSKKIREMNQDAKIALSTQEFGQPALLAAVLGKQPETLLAQSWWRKLRS